MCATVNRNKIFEYGSIQPFTNKQGDWRRKLCALEICEEKWERVLITPTQNIVEIIEIWCRGSRRKLNA